MDIHEYQNKRIFKEHDLPVLKGGVAYTPQEAVTVAREIGGSEWLIKVQTHDVNRETGFFTDLPDEKQGGVRLVHSEEEVKVAAENMLGHSFLSPSMRVPQVIQRVYVEETCQAAKKVGMSVRIDFVRQCVILTVESNQKISEFALPRLNVGLFFWYKVVRAFDLKGVAQAKLAPLLRRMYQVFLHYHAVAVECRSLVWTNDGKWVIEDGRIVFDKEALSRFPEINALREVSEGREREALAEKYNFRYTPLDGNIACLVNGSGLGAATIELLSAHQGRSACLLDVGTEPTGEAVARALKLALSVPNVDGVFINIFGGLTRCDIIAQGLIEASREISAGIPIVVRMDGTNAHVGERLLFESRLPFTVIKEPEEAVVSIIKLVGALQ